MNCSEAGYDLFWYRLRCFCCVNQVVLMLTRNIFITKAEWSVAKQGHLHCELNKKSRFVHVTFFVFKYSKRKTTSNVLNSDVHIINIALITSCSLAVTKLAHRPMSSLLSCGSLANSLLQLSFVLALLWLNSVWRGFSVSLIAWRCLDLARWPNLTHWPSLAR